MAHDRNTGQAVPAPNSGNEEIPLGATVDAFRRPVSRGHGKPGSGAGPRHAAGDEHSVNEEYGAVDINEPAADPTADLDAEERLLTEGLPEAYAGPAGGAVGGTPANKRASGGHKAG